MVFPKVVRDYTLSHLSRFFMTDYGTQLYLEFLNRNGIEDDTRIYACDEAHLKLRDSTKAAIDDVDPGYCALLSLCQGGDSNECEDFPELQSDEELEETEMHLQMGDETIQEWALSHGLSTELREELNEILESYGDHCGSSTGVYLELTRRQTAQ